MKSVRMSGKKAVTGLALVAILATACGGTSADPPSEPSEPDTGQETTSPDGTPFEITMAVSSDMTELDPHLSTTNWNQVVWYDNVSERLTAFEDGEIVPGLATAWEMVGDTTWRFELVEGATFHNGEPFNADAVVYNLERIQAEETASTIVSFFASITGATAVDEYTVEFTTDGAAPFLPQYPLPYLIMLPPEAMQNDPGGIQQNPIGTGPYVATSVSSDGVVLEKNTDYWGGTPSGPDRVTIVPRPEVASRMAGLQAGELDIIWDVPPELVDQAPSLHRTPASRNHHLLLNSVNGPTQDVRVREAIALAIDKIGNAEAIYGEGNYAPTTCQLVPEGVIGYVDEPDLTEPVPFDPDRARELLEEADAVGSTVRFLTSIGRYPGAEQVSEIIAQQLRDVGLVVEYMPLEFQSFLDGARTEAASRVEVTYIGSSYDTGSIQQTWGYWAQPNSAYLNFSHTDYPDLKTAMDAALAATDPARSQELFTDVARTFCEDFLYVQLHRATYIFGKAETLSLESFDEVIPFARIRQS